MQYAYSYTRLILFVVLFSITTCPVHAEVTLCDCMNKPMDTDEKVTTCTKIFDSLDPETSLEQRTACRNRPPPPGGPDKCYCLKTSSQDPEVREICSAMFEGVDEADLMRDIRSCAGKPFE